MTQKSFPIAPEFLAAANITAEQYAEQYKQSVASPEATDAFWAKRAELIEVKPMKETTLEAAGRSKRSQAAVVLNYAKWEAASKWAKRNGMIFRIVTEADIFKGGK